MKLACDALVHHAATRPHAMAIIDESGVEHSWAAIERGSVQVCRAIEGSTAPGASIAISLPSGASFWMCVLGVARAARRPVLLPCPLPGAVRAKVMLEISPSLLIDQARAEELLGLHGQEGQEGQEGQDGRVVQRGQRTGPAAMHGAQRPDGATEGGALPGVVLLSSGTTGRSSFVLRSSAAVDHIGQILLAEGLVFAGDRVASFLPMAHAYGFEHAFLAPVMAGACVEVLGAFSIDRAAEAIARGATTMPLVPAAASALAHAEIPAGALRSCTVAGASLPPAVRAAFQQARGIPLVDLYGATELGTIWLDRGAGGVPVDGTEIRIVDASIAVRLVDLAPGQEGEVAVRSASMLAGIVGAHGAIEPARCEGFFRTGDLARCSDGALRLTGRVKFIFDVGGLKVNPIDVEHALESHASVRAALVHPVEAAPMLSRVAARIEAADPAHPPSGQELRAFLAPLIPAHSMPRSFEFVERLPRTASGKLLRAGAVGAQEAAPAEAVPPVPPVRAVPPEPSVPPVRQRPAALQDRAAREAFTQRLFDQSAQGYDHSSGYAFLRSGRWYRRRMLLRNGLHAGSAHLDVGSGTGLCAALSQEIVGPQGRVVALDPSPGMLEVARRRGVRETVLGRAEQLPFADASFDLVSMSYMLRHIDDLALAFAEARRVLRPGGRLVIFEVTRPSSPPARMAFGLAMHWVVPGLGVVASGRVATFRMMKYWAQTIDDAVPPERIVQAIERSRFAGARHQLELGIFSCYRGIAPSAAT